MYHDSQIAQLLHDEHLRTIDLMNRLEEATSGRRAKSAPADDDTAAKLLLADLHAELQGTAEHHFSFEEENIFPALMAIGDVGIPTILRQEHALLRNVSETLLPLVERAREGGFTEPDWLEFRDLALDLVERHITHIQKEEMGLLPALSSLFDAEAASELVIRYAEK
ncbi:MAG: hemerythrin domain-containing protein [Rhodospirillaceae bacterium]|nr:hemerythrin domain-containing protein [Rhodospirillaceae bacterium]MBT5899266.1 hemerythrin domain-containing protein [Rhodospirillaceae bacterium]MBT6429683.1 hemerythrin domain-containing protein [Rhodospirillaceae bacterium]MBT7758900.1 hemerythrin domain-containing protein [Rhodospirillaceae bacterium]